MLYEFRLRRSYLILFAEREYVVPDTIFFSKMLVEARGLRPVDDVPFHQNVGLIPRLRTVPSPHNPRA